jgi:CheY-like chemotaxis protein
MEAEALTRAFEPFYSTKGAAGTGLGLASVRESAERFGGFATAASEPGRGSTFTVYLPAAEGAAEPGPVPKPVPGGGGAATVLVVDDDAAVRRVIGQGLAQHGFAVLEASNAEDALLVARRHRDPIHLLLTNWAMPGIPVRQLVLAFRQLFPAARVLLCSGWAAEDVGPFTEIVDGFLPKPFTVSGLVAKIRSLAPDVEPARAGVRGGGEA